MARPKNDTELLEKKIHEDNDLMIHISNEIGTELLIRTILNEKMKYSDNLYAFRIFCMLRMNKNNDIYCKDTVEKINWRYKLLLEDYARDQNQE